MESKILRSDTMLLTGQERTFPEDEIIVSKTDTKGRLTYVNDVFQKVSGFTEDELMGKPHNIVRHPDTPRCLFKLMWDTIATGKEIFVYINNRAKNGDHYWVFAHVTPDLDSAGRIVGYHSNRRVPRRDVITKLKAIYEQLLQEERRHSDVKQGIEASGRLLDELLSREGKSYEEFVHAL